MSLSPLKASQLLEKQGHLHVVQERAPYLIPAMSRDIQARHIFDVQFHYDEVLQVILFVQDKIIASPEYLQLGERILHRYQKDHSLKDLLIPFDRALGIHRKKLDYVCPENQQALAKWRQADQEDEIFRRHPDFTKLLETSKLLPQIKITRDHLRIIDDEPALLVEGIWTKASAFSERFEVIFSEPFDQAFVVEKSTRRVYTYLDNQKGLERHNPFQNPLGKPISTWDEKGYQKTLKKAREFKRPGEENSPERNEERTQIIQIVSSQLEGPNTNLYNVWLKARHPWYRFMEWDPDAQEAKVYEIGFGWKEQPWLPLKKTSGRFRSPDPWENRAVDARVVTNIAVTPQELTVFRSFLETRVNNYLEVGEKLNFQLDHQNCTSLIYEGQNILGIPIDTRVRIQEIIWKCSPTRVQQVCLAAEDAWLRTRIGLQKNIYPIIPACLKTAAAAVIKVIQALFFTILNAFAAFALNPLRVLLGGTLGKKGASLNPSDSEKHSQEHEEWHWYNSLSLNSYWFHLPSKLQEWQRKQASTVVTRHPIRLSIVPEDEKNPIDEIALSQI
jgi:hypothetical protein